MFETLVNEKNELRKKFKFLKNVINIINSSNHGEILFNEFLNNIKEAEPKDLEFFRYVEIINNLKKFNLNDNQLKLIRDALNISINKFVNKYIDKIFVRSLPKNFILQFCDCLTEQNKEKFIKFADENPIKFIGFFSHIKYDKFSVEDIEINYGLLNKYVSNQNLMLNIEKLNKEELSIVDKLIIETFIEDVEQI